MFLIIPILVEILIDVLTPLNKVFISLIQPNLHLLIRRLHRVEESLILGALVKRMDKLVLFAVSALLHECLKVLDGADKEILDCLELRLLRLSIPCELGGELTDDIWYKGIVTECFM